MSLFHDKCQPWEKALAAKDRETEILKAINSELREVLKDLQSQCGYGSPWWIKIEKALNPSNPVLLGESEER